MEVRLTPKQAAVIEQAVASGNFANAEEALALAVALLEDRERRLADLRALVDEGDADFAEGRYTEYDDVTIKNLADELINEARALRDSGKL
jgi:putative addiction module CopG family antidote